MSLPVKQRLSRIVRQIATSTVALSRSWPKASALLIGIASATGFAPLGLWPMTLVAVALLMLLLAGAPTPRRAFGLGWAFGIGHFALGLNWIATAFTYQAAMPAWLGWIAVVALSLYLAVFPGLATWGAWLVARTATQPRPPSPRHPREGGEPAPEIATAHAEQLDSRLRADAEGRETQLAPLCLALAGLWIVTEWLRSWMFTGFAWNPLGAVAIEAGNLPVVFGSYGLSGWIVLTAGAGALLVHRHWRAATLFGMSALVVLTIVNLGFGTRNANAADERGLPITLVQPNIGQQDKWQGDKADRNFAKLARLTNPIDDRPRLILWPEAAVPDYLETGYPWIYYDRSPAAARARLMALMNPDDLMLLGALKLETDQTGEVVGARNAVMMVRPDGTLGPRYDKAHLVPFGEYLPMRPLLSAIGLSRLVPGDIDFWPGPGPRTLDLGLFGTAGIQICYEIIFSGQVVDRANRPDFIFNPSNDAWFGSWGPPQHLAQARLRAIEEGLPVVRSTPTGISAVISANGDVVASVPMGVDGRIDMRLPPPHAPTPFARFGNMLPLLLAAAMLVLAIASARRCR